MKLIRYSIFMLTALFLFSCEEENENIGRGESINDFKLLSPGNFSSVTLNPSTPEKTILLAWESPKTGLGSEPSYKVLFDKKGGDFTSPLLSVNANQSGKASNASVAFKDLKDVVQSAGTSELIWTVESSTETSLGINRKQAMNGFSLTVNLATVGFTDFAYLSPTLNQKLAIDKVRTPNDVIEFSWEASTATSGNVTYKWVAATTPNGFDEPVLEYFSDNDGKDPKLTLTHAELADALKEITYEDGLYWQVRATSGDAFYAPETRFVWFEIFDVSSLYIVGSFTGWNNNCTDAIAFSNKGNGIFESVVNIPANSEFKLVLTCGSWEVNWGNPSNDPIVSDATYYLDAPGNNIKVSNAGNYSIVVDFAAGTFKLTQFTAGLYLVGDATLAGWNNNSTVAMFQNPSNTSQFSYTGKFYAGSMKFLSTPGQWQPQYGKGSADGVLGVNDGTGSDPNVISIPAEGYYTVQVDLSALTYSVTPYDVSGKPTYTSIGVIGPATPNGWNGPDVDLIAYAGDPHQWYVDGQQLVNDEAKFRANDSWDVNWGGNTAPYGVGTGGGPNVPLSQAGNYLIRFCDLTGQYAFIKK